VPRARPRRGRRSSPTACAASSPRANPTAALTGPRRRPSRSRRTRWPDRRSCSGWSSGRARPRRRPPPTSGPAASPAGGRRWARRAVVGVAGGRAVLALQRGPASDVVLDLSRPDVDAEPGFHDAGEVAALEARTSDYGRLELVDRDRLADAVRELPSDVRRV